MKSNLIKKRVDNIAWAFYLCNRSLSEIELVTNTEHNNTTFHFYVITLQYTYIMEYKKLLETWGSKKNHTASIYNLNKILKKEYKIGYIEIYKENEQRLNTIIDSSYFKQLKLQRDKKYGHSDEHQINVPYEIKTLTPSEINIGFSQLKVILDILNSISGFLYKNCYGLSVPHRDKRTANFIKYHEKYKKFYFDNNGHFKQFEK